MSRIAVVNFNSGEVTPDIDARKDIEKYTGACRRLENMIPDVYGNATRRPGTELIVVGNGSGCYFETPPTTGKTGISTAQELQDIENNLSDDYELLNDIDLTGFDWTPIGHRWRSQGSGFEFSGTLDGRFFTISNLTINQRLETDTGLFAVIVGGTVENLIIENCTINTALAAPSRKGSEFIGFLSGTFGATSTARQVAVINGIMNFSAPDFPAFPDFKPDGIGGLVGRAQTSALSTIVRCSTDITITITEAEANFWGAGGFLGNLSANITDCYSKGRFVGSSPDPTQPSSSSRVGGFLGRCLDNTVITNCYSATFVDYGPDTDMGFAGGVVLSGNSPIMTSCYWDTQVSGHATSKESAVGKTTAQMFKEATYTGWDFDSTNGVWMINEGNDYPRHRWEHLATECKRL